MKAKISDCTAVLLVISVGMTWQASARGFDVWGVGNDSRGTYIQEYAAYRRGEHRERFRLEISWLQGFLTAENGESFAQAFVKLGKQKLDTKEFDILRGADVEATQLWLANYCQAHPLDNLADAAIALTQILIQKSR
jgi:hypothetical protein